MKEYRVWGQIPSLHVRISRVPALGELPTLAIRLASYDDLIECEFLIDHRSDQIDLADTMSIWIFFKKWSQYWASVDSRYVDTMTEGEERMIAKAKRIMGIDLGEGFRVCGDWVS